MALDMNIGNAPKAGLETLYYEVWATHYPDEVLSASRREDAIAFMVSKVDPRFAERSPELNALIEGLEPGGYSQLAAMSRTELGRIFNAISTPRWVTLEAPVVGEDAAADAWLEQQMTKDGFDDEKKAQTLVRMAGYYALEAMEDSDAFPNYTNHVVGHANLDRTSFRGLFLEHCKDVLVPQDLANAYEPMLPDRFLAYGKRLFDQAARARRSHSVASAVPLWELTDPNVKPKPIATQIHIVESCAAWCKLWANLGHSYEPYF